MQRPLWPRGVNEAGKHEEDEEEKLEEAQEDGRRIDGSHVCVCVCRRGAVRRRRDTGWKEMLAMVEGSRGEGEER